MPAPPPPAAPLTSPRLTLRRAELADTDALHCAVAESLTHLRPWLGWAAGAYDRAAARRFIVEADQAWQTGTPYPYVLLRGGQLAGICSLRRTAPGVIEIGYWLHRKHTGHGLATEAAGAVLAQAWTMADIERVQIWHDEANTASAGVPARLGFIRIDRRVPPRHGLTPAEAGVDVVWELAQPASPSIAT